MGLRSQVTLGYQNSSSATTGSHDGCDLDHIQNDSNLWEEYLHTG